MYRVSSLFLAAVCIGCFGFGSQTFALGSHVLHLIRQEPVSVQIMMIGKRSMYRVSAALSLFLVIHPVHRVLVSSYAPLIVHQHILPVAVRVILPAVVRVIPTQGDLAQLPAAVRVILTRVLPGIGSVPIQALLPNPMALPGTGSPSGPSTSGSGPGSSSGSGASPCRGSSGRTGSCVASCSSPSDLISPASGCATGQSCCAGAAAATGSGAGAGGGTKTISIKNPVAFNTVEALLSGGILPWLQGIVATIALVFFVIGAVMYMTGGVDEGNVKQGKATMTAALAGFALALAAPTFLKEIYGIFGASSSTAARP
jgi:hypothetical protein